MVTIGWRCEPFKVEMVIRGYLTGHAWREYKAGRRTLCGVPLPGGMVENQRFPEPIITPTTKAAEGHDEDISRSSAERIILPDATELLDYMLNRFKGILENLVVYPGIMLDNLWRTRGVIFAHLGELCAFRAAIALLRERGMEQLIADTYRACKTDPLSANHVRNIYAPFTVGEINDKIVEMLQPDGMEAPVELVFQSIEGLHQACPGHPGDWYFTGRYPTPGGIRLCNAAFVDDVKEACPDICGNL